MVDSPRSDGQPGDSGGPCCCLLSVPLLAYCNYAAALVIILINRLIYGLDGTIARQGGPTAFGGYLDIVCDMVFYAAIPLGFALACAGNAVWATVLLVSFSATAACCCALS
jgi:phosphatidylglycerophosphate synthase